MSTLAPTPHADLHDLTPATGDPPNPHDPPSRSCDDHPAPESFVPCTVAGDEPEVADDGPCLETVPCTDPAERARRASRLGGIVALPEESARGVMRLVGTLRGVAASLMLLTMLGPAGGGALPVQVDGHGHHAPVENTDPVDTHQATVATTLTMLYALVVTGWNALRAPESCQDCNLPVDDGCRCECYSGGYDPNDPACQD